MQYPNYSVVSAALLLLQTSVQNGDEVAGVTGVFLRMGTSKDATGTQKESDMSIIFLESFRHPRIFYSHWVLLYRAGKQTSVLGTFSYIAVNERLRRFLKDSVATVFVSTKIIQNNPFLDKFLALQLEIWKTAIFLLLCLFPT